MSEVTKRIVIVAVAIGLVASFPSRAWNAGAAAATKTVRRSPLPAAVAVANPFSGSYAWQGVTPQPSGWPTEDAYVRFTWRELEPSPGRYDFSQIDRQLAAAKATGGKFGFRIQSACTGCSSSMGNLPAGIPSSSCVAGQRATIAVPDYLADEMRQGWCFRLNGTENYAPDWNDPVYLTRLQALLNALGARYDHDPRLGWVDISAYGDFGEWHVYQWPYPAPTGATPITLANGDAIVDMNHAAFPNKTLVSLTQTTTTSGDYGPFLYALRRYPNVGIRLDCFGDSYYTSYLQNLYTQYPFVANRWKTAPFIGEYCGGGLSTAYAQIKQFHVAMVGNGNVGQLSGPDLQQFEADNIAAGYRFVLRSIQWPTTVKRGNAFGVQSTWSNIGVTPAYGSWQIMLELRSGSRVVWARASKLKLNSFLPGNRSVADRFTLPTGLKAGTYNVALSVNDPNRYYAPLRLAVAGRARDGSYPLGTVSVR